MHRRDFIRLLILPCIFSGFGCQPSQIRQGISAGSQLARGSVSGAVTSMLPGTGVPELDSLVRRGVQEMVQRLMEEWGDEKVPTQTEYVKYTDDYQTRAVINFETGNIRVETVEEDNPRQKLKTAIVHTLLTPEDPARVDLLSDEQVSLGPEPFLHNVVLDHEDTPIRWEWRANRYAEYLMRTAYQTDVYNQRKRHFVTLSMVEEHGFQQQKRYQGLVYRHSRRFGVDPALVYAIMEVESSFNPYAMSHVPAYGLMQIVPETAGRDAHLFIYNRKGTPTRDYLFVPDNNIRMGSAYLHILFNRYLNRVTNARSREYCVIAGYNTGSGNVLRAFHSNRDRAFERINSMNSRQVYEHMVRNLPYQETRDYLPKVVRARTRYA
ncbi:Lytic transglycosylase catalytic [Desulfonatronospira thiodismutans ASO3-1]|uniref:Lytic transglycosylase catalytic n=1 Tax=Desulfonatronospira thiodismutans ASO3-1 TaxID=555779 RepID=D6SUF3_9BACT|nr:murein transglycosylase domain-containing protein [Desulfonatronospira thiodismutans]EFI32933.1 Lytic transglycosylase catalytic [Desulfonatronospira thiodismutans ASO3-1]